MNASMEMPRYKCFKHVWALEIASVEGDVMTFKEEPYAPIKASEGLFARYTPKPGDFYVVYKDGYKSISPREAFLDGYVPE